MVSQNIKDVIQTIRRRNQFKYLRNGTAAVSIVTKYQQKTESLKDVIQENQFKGNSQQFL